MDEETVFFKKACCKNQKTPAASLKRRKHGLGLPIHIKYQPILLNIRYYIILVLNSLLYIHYFQFPIIIRDFPSDFPKKLAQINTAPTWESSNWCLR